MKLTKIKLKEKIKSEGYGFSSLLGVGNNAKTIKSDIASQWRTGIVYLAPNARTCANSKSAKCLFPCINTAGRGRMEGVQRVRHDRTAAFFANPKLFMALLRLELTAHASASRKRGKYPAVRLNGTSDLNWIDVIRDNPQIMFYDYSKIHSRVKRWARGELPENYHLTLSWSGASGTYKAQTIRTLKQCPDVNTAVVFRDKAMVDSIIGDELMGRTVIDGDKTDLRFLDPVRSIVALYAKGSGKRDTSGFVVDNPDALDREYRGT